MRILICYKTYYELMKEIVKQCQRKFSEWQEEHEMFNLQVYSYENIALSLFPSLMVSSYSSSGSVLCQVYEVYQLMDQLHADNVAGPTLGFLISVYAVTSGSAFFAVQTSSVQNRAARTRVVSNKIIFCGINILFGSSMILCMVNPSPWL